MKRATFNDLSQQLDEGAVQPAEAADDEQDREPQTKAELRECAAEHAQEVARIANLIGGVETVPKLIVLQCSLVHDRRNPLRRLHHRFLLLSSRAGKSPPRDADSRPAALRETEAASRRIARRCTPEYRISPLRCRRIERGHASVTTLVVGGGDE